MTFRFLLSFILSQTLLAILSLTVVILAATVAANDSGGNSGYLNVYGDVLQPCSSDGMALTGYTRSGYCVDQNDDSGSHHICIDLSSLGGGDDDSQNNQNFCDVTGQSDWCSSQDMPCQEDPYTSECPVTNWCVCQWAFASYIQGSGGCENIQNIVCESINQQALLAYQKQLNSDQKYQDALDCLVDRCGLDSSQLSATSLYSTDSGVRSSAVGGFEIIIAMFAVLTGAIVYVYRRPGLILRTIELNKDEEELGKKDTRDNFIST